MSGRPRKGINFGSGQAWRAVSVISDEQTADNLEASMDVRLLALARARMDFGNHSHFKRGELRERLAYVVKSGPKAGEVRKPTRQAITTAIGRLVEWGVFSPGSWSECIVYPPFAVQNGFKATPSTPCPTRRDN